MSPASTATALSLGRRVVRVLATAKTVDAAATAVLREIADAFSWDVGVLWLLDERSGLLRWGGQWARDEPTGELGQSFARLTFAPGVGVPGEVLSSVTGRWIDDLDRQRLDRDAGDVPRGDSLLAAGLRMLVAVPAVAGNGPMGVVEFMARTPEPESRERADAITLVAQQLAEYVTRVRVEERLRSSEAASASIVRAALDCIVTMDHRGRVVDFNPAAEHAFGYVRDEVIGERLADLIIPPALRDAHHTALERHVATGEARILNQRLELEGMRSDGSTFPVELTVTRLGASEPPVFAGFLRDITARRLAEDDLERALTSERVARTRAEDAERAARGAAEALQRSLLPPHLPAVPGLQFGAVYRAGAEGWQVGGDFYDVFERGPGQWALVIGDVCGKGLEAAALTATVRYALRGAAVRHEAPRDVLADVNAVLLGEPGRPFCTAIYATLDVRGERPVICMAAGGHPPPLLVRTDGRVQPIGRPGTLLGGFRNASSHHERVELDPGETLVLYTDGLTEARTSAGRFGVAGLAEVLAHCARQPASEVAARAEAAVLAAASDGVSDDLAVLAVSASAAAERPIADVGHRRGG